MIFKPAYNQFMKSTLRLNAKVFPVVALIALVMQIVDPSRVWMILLIGLGGIWLVCRWWVRGLQRSLVFEREMRFGWAQVGDRLEDCRRVVLGAGAVVGGRERPLEDGGLSGDEGRRQSAEGAPHVPRRDVAGVEEPDLHGPSMPNFFILL